MKEIVFVTSNKGKIASAQRELDNIKVLEYNVELIEPRSQDITEIAKQKVIQAYKMVGKPCISLDTGFYVEELNGFPNTYVNHMLETIGLKGLLKLMEGVENRYCEFKSCLAYYDGKNFDFFYSIAKGSIAHSIRGIDKEIKWSDLWYIYIPKDFEKTLAEFSDEEFTIYNKVKDENCIKKFGKWYGSF